MGNHTPTPWKLAEYIDNGRAIRRDTHIHNDTDQRQVAHVGDDLDARFIVQACNAHFALTETLGYCIGFITGEHSTTEADREEVLEYARTAMAIARGS